VSRFSRAVPLTGTISPGRQHPSFQVVFYLATTINPAIAKRSADLVAADHERFSHVLDLMERLDQPPVVVLTSSGGAVYDTRLPPPYSEHSLTRPRSAYGAAKLALELELNGRGAAIPGAVLRLANVYGPGQRTGTGLGVVAHWLAAAAAGDPLTLFGDAQARRDYVYVDDVVVALTGVYDHICGDPAARAHGLPTLNIGSGTPTSLAQLLGHVERITGRRLDVHRAGGRDFDPQDNWLDTTTAARLIGWSARTQLAEGLARTWHSIRPMASRVS
jgi:UDP-glucose 4-epimerase